MPLAHSLQPCACDRVGEDDLAAMLAAGYIDALLPAIAAHGGRPGSAVVVLTDRHNVGWFFDEGHAPAVPPSEHQVTLGRRLDAVLPRLFAVCPVCAVRLANVPLTHLPVLLRLGPTGEMALGAVRFPEHLRAVASAAAPTPYAGARPVAVRALTEGELPGPASSPLSAEDRARADRAILRAILGDHQHPEAFCLLRYRNARGSIELVWNSRDGSVPPAFEHPLTGEVFALEADAPLTRAPEHRPAQGDLVWVTLTEARARARRRSYVRARWETGDAFVGALCDDPRYADMEEHELVEHLVAHDVAAQLPDLVRWGLENAS